MADVSSYNRQVVPMNPLATLGQMTHIQAGMNQNMLFSQEFADRAAQNRAYQFALDPNTGQIDYGKLAQGLANMGAGRLLPQAIQQMQEQQARLLGIDTAKVELARKNLDNLNSGLTALLARPNVGKQDVAAKMAEMIAQGVVSAQTAASFLAGLPDDPQGIKQRLNEQMVQSLGSAERLAALMPKPTQVDAGGAIGFVDTNPMTNPNIGQTVIPKTMDPATAGSFEAVMVRNPDGTLTPSKVTRAQAVEMSQSGPLMTAPPLTASGLTPAEAAGTVEITGPDGTKYTVTKQQFLGMTGGGGGAMRGAPAAPGARGAAVSQGMPGVQSGPRPGQIPAADKAATVAAEAMTQDMQFAATAPQRIFQLESAETALANADVKTGPGTETVNTIKSFLSNVPIAKYGIDLNEVKDYETARKYLTQYAIGQAGSMGQGTDSKLAAAFTGNPNTSMTKLSAQDLIKSAVGLERMGQAVALAWNESGNPPEDYNKWRVKFVKDLDPTVFVLDKLAPAQLSKKLEQVRNMPPKQREGFAKSYNLAVQTGLIPNLAAQ